MIKKLLGICTTLVPLALMSGNVALADTGSYRFTDTSSIRDDITQLGLDYQDYKLISDKNYDRTDVIALSESYIDSGNTKQIVNYVYVYNPYSIKEDVTSFVLKYNESSITQKVESYTKDYFLNIVKYKVDFKMPTYSDLKRRYDISSLTFSNGNSCKIDFGCIYNQDGSNVQLDYDSYIFITGKELFDYIPFYFEDTWSLDNGYQFKHIKEYDNSDSNSKSYYSDDSSQYLIAFNKTSFFDMDSVSAIPDLFYLNFDTNKKIDSINEIDLSYKLYKGLTYDYDSNGGDFKECIDEIENHLHPALIRTLIRELRNVANTIIISTTHSSVVINELKMEEIIDISGTSINSLNETYIKKLNTFLHPGRNELMLADNIILVEGYTEEVLLKHYLSKNNYNWTIINVAGVMFEPYIQLASLLNKKVIVVSDNDKLLSDNQESSSRFSNLKLICTEKNIKLIEIENTLETDLYINGFLNNCNDLLEKHKKYPEFYVAKHKKKVEIAERLIENDIDLSNWHAIEEIENGFKSN